MSARDLPQPPERLSPEAPDLATLYEVVDATWPTAAITPRGPWLLREGQGGGKRVSAAVATGPVTDPDIDEAEAWMRAQGQTPLVQIRDGQTQLDAQLQARGWQVVDPVNLWLAPARGLTGEMPPKVHAYTLWEPLQIQYATWRRGGLDEGRFAVMDRAPQPKTAVLARWSIHKGGTAFAAIHAGTAMVHAVEVEADRRRHGVARALMLKAAEWAHDAGAQHIAVVCTKANEAANGLYASLGMSLVGEYHYRMKEA